MNDTKNKEHLLTDQRIIELRRTTKPDFTRPYGDTLAFARAVETEVTAKVVKTLEDDLKALMITYNAAVASLETSLDNLQKIDSMLRNRKPFYAMRRKGLHYWCTITKEQYDDLKGRPLFDTCIFYQE